MSDQKGQESGIVTLALENRNEKQGERKTLQIWVSGWTERTRKHSRIIENRDKRNEMQRERKTLQIWVSGKTERTKKQRYIMENRQKRNEKLNVNISRSVITRK